MSRFEYSVNNPSHVAFCELTIGLGFVQNGTAESVKYLGTDHPEYERLVVEAVKGESFGIFALSPKDWYHREWVRLGFVIELWVFLVGYEEFEDGGYKIVHEWNDRLVNVIEAIQGAIKRAQGMLKRPQISRYV
jgi:hypothetical protein